MTYILSSFSGDVAELPRSQRNEEGVLLALNQSPNVSEWDMSEKSWLRILIQQLQTKDLLVREEAQFPWNHYRLTEAGKLRLREMARMEN